MAPERTVLFVCLHGSAKSVIAARHLERLAAERGRGIRARAAGVEPDADFPASVVAGLAADGLPALEGKPVPVTPELVAAADLVVTLGCDVAATSKQAPVVRWEGLPAVSDGYGAARDAIVDRLPTVLDLL